MMDDKASITAIASITADDTHYKLPIFALLKGKTQNALRKLNDIGGIGKAVSINGWSTQSSMILFFKWLKEVHHEIFHDRAGYNKTDAIDLIWDMYPSHRTDLIKRLYRRHPRKSRTTSRRGT